MYYCPDCKGYHDDGVDCSKDKKTEFYFCPICETYHAQGYCNFARPLEYIETDKVKGPVETRVSKMIKQYQKVMDSGKRQEFPTGSVRDTREGKGRYDLIAPYALQRLAQHYENGAKKYGDRNWEKGQNLSRYLDSAARHLFKYLGGSREEDHLAAVAWNVFSYIQTEQWIKEGRLPVELDDVENLTTTKAT